jgi:hypothetical protein
MNKSVANSPVLLIDGDSVVNWMITVPEAGSSDRVETRYLLEQRFAAPGLTSTLGGAAFIAEIVGSMAGRANVGLEVQGPTVAFDALSDPNISGVSRSYSVWRPLRRNAGDPTPVWRMERLVGLQIAPEDQRVSGSNRPDRSFVAYFDDLNIGYRRDQGRWSSILESDDLQHVVIRQTGSLGQGPLYQSLLERFPEKVTLCCAVGELRKEGGSIGESLSWEKTAQDIEAAVRDRPEMRQVSRVIVTLAASGAVILERGKEPILIFDPAHQEGDWERERPGVQYGVAACIVGSLLLSPESLSGSDLCREVKLGLAAARVLHEDGFTRKLSERSEWTIEFPGERVAPALHDEGEGFQSFCSVEISSVSNWRIFQTSFSENYRHAAEQIAINGEGATAREVPNERMGAWSSIDRIEIESMRSIRNIISEYLSQSKKRRPLNLAVFGPPGSGKSFAIKQMAKQLSTSGSNIATLEFNVSQFQDLGELSAALQRVRDLTVEQALPLVFWDEFDSKFENQEMGWLVRFLAPMQDGAFAEAGGMRPIGPAIFVFAGGTHATMESFKSRAVELPDAKATDFISRLRGYVNVLGPNPAHPDDQSYLLRRAMLLRAMIRTKSPMVFAGNMLNIDPSVLRAFLEVPHFVHGSRSMEAIVEMSALSGALTYERSLLPAAHQLELHVDADAFMSLVEGSS